MQESYPTGGVAARGSGLGDRIHRERAYFAGVLSTITRPAFITNLTRRTAVMSSSGLPSVATRSASQPGAIVPISLPRPSDSADIEVALVSASIAVSPASLTR